MRLDFNVLWLDDQPDRVHAQIRSIARQMEEEAFSFNPKLCNTLDEIQASLADDVFTDEVDLILVDWDLGAGLEGQEAIFEIRKHIPYKDVVFYSAQSQPDGLRRRAYDRGLEGVYCCSREGLVDEVVGVFDSLVKKVLDLDHSRGIVMGATSDIDHMVSQCLISFFEAGDDDAKNEIIKEALELITTHLDGLAEKFKELKTAQDIFPFMEAYAVFTAYHRLRILSRLLKSETIADHNWIRPAVTDYMQKVVPGRNLLGHVLLVPDGKPQEVVTAGGDPITLDETRELRRKILAFREQVRTLHDSLGSN